MWKNVVAASLAAFLAAGLVGAFAGSIPYFNPQQLQIPATGADLNALVAQINSNAVTNGPASSTGLPGGAGQSSVAFSVNAANSTNPFPGFLGVSTISLGVNPGIAAAGTPNANGVQITGGTPGVAPTVQAVGSDPNVGIAFAPQGSGLVQFVSPTSWIASPTLTPCPVGRNSVFPPNTTQLPLTTTYTEALLVRDVMGNVVALPGCIVGSPPNGL